MRLLDQLRDKKKIFYGKDIFTGIIIGLVSIPISMGYAQIAGLPVVYGLYGSLFPILLFSFLTTSPQFAVGVDAMPAVMVGSLMAQLGIGAESKDAMTLVPLMAVLVAIWFVVFYFLKAGGIVKFISTPVMGGFISGVGFTIIMMQVPKLFGGNAGTGEIFVLLEHIVEELPKFNALSFMLGFGTIVIILACKKIIPKVPMTVVMLILGALLQGLFRLDRYGVKLLPEVAGGLPHLVFPNPLPFLKHFPELLIQSASIAAVIMAQTLLATGSYAMKHGDKIDNNAELLAYAAMNFASAVTGSCPINGSVSRSGIVESMGGRSQIMSVSAFFTMLLVLLFGTPFFKYLPVPILTGIVVTALIGIIDMAMSKRLWKTNKNEWLVFMAAFLGVLVFGTINGVLIGVLLSFGEVAVRAVNPPVSFLGMIPGHSNFYSISRNSAARPVKKAVIYRFSGNLFFANIDKFQKDIEGAIKPDTKLVIVDARGMGSVDITAVDRLVMLHKNLKMRGVHFYITEHDGSLNDQLRKLGGESLIEEDAVRRTITLALRDAGIKKPYELDMVSDGESEYVINDIERANEADERLSEFEWLFGRDDATRKMEQMANVAAEKIVQSGMNGSGIEADIFDERGVQTEWGKLGLFDESAFLDLLELRLEELVAEGKISKDFAADIEARAEKRRKIEEQKLDGISPHAMELIKKHRQELYEYIKNNHPEEYELLNKIRNEKIKD